MASGECGGTHARGRGYPRRAQVPWMLAGLLLALLVAAPAAAVPLYSPGTIAAPGEYELMTDILDDANSTTFNIRASGVRLDGMGHTIGGQGKGIGIMAYDFTMTHLPPDVPLYDIAITNLTVMERANGIVFQNVHESSIEGVTVHADGIGIGLVDSTYDKVRDSYVYGGNDGATAAFLLESTQYVTIDNCQALELYGMKYTPVPGAGFMVNRSLDASLRSASTGGWTTGFRIIGSTGTTIEKSQSLSNSDGMVVSHCHETTVTGTDITDNSIGMVIENDEVCDVRDSTISRNVYNGIQIAASYGCTFTGNTIEDNNVGLYLSAEPSGNLIYDNRFNNPENVAASATATLLNDWNVSLQAGTNIVGGSLLGGNYWAQPDGNGFSQTTFDTDGDGICDEPYYVAVVDEHVDWLPLGGIAPQRFSGYVYQGSSGSTTTPLVGAEVILTGSMTPLGGIGGPTGWLISSATTDASGYYELPISDVVTYYRIYEVDPAEYVSIDTASYGGTTPNPMWIEFTGPIGPHTMLSGNNFWDEHFIADFSTNTTSGSAPLAVQFNDSSIGPVSERIWDFGDGSTSTLPDPTHVYLTSGRYTVNLTIQDTREGVFEHQDGTIKEDYIRVDEPGDFRADFTANVTEGPAPLAVQFTDASAGSPTGWAWIFGDGTTSAVQSPVYVYTLPGTYTVGLTITNALGGNLTEKAAFIRVDPPSANLPVANFSANVTSGEPPLSVAFTDTSEVVAATGYTWDFDDDESIDSALPNPVHVYDTAGSYTVNFTVTNASGSDSERRTGAVSVTVPYVYQPPVADFTATGTSGEAPLTVQFTDLTSGYVDTWSWSFGDGTTSTAKNPVHTFGEGTFSVGLSVTNAAGTNTKLKAGFIHVEPCSTCSGSDSGGGGGGGGSGSLSSSEPDVSLAANESSETEPLIPVPQDASPSSGSYTNPLDIPGLTIRPSGSAGGDPEVLVDRDRAEAAGFTVTVGSSSVGLSRDTTTVTIYAAGIAESGVIITGTLQSITIQTGTFGATLGIGYVEVWLEAQVEELPEGADITVAITDAVPAEVAGAFERAATRQELTLDSIAYIVFVNRTNLPQTGPARIGMSIPPAWVEQHGGKDAIRIARIPDAGEPHVLSTRYDRTDARGNLVFEGVSPDGLSVFGMISTKAKAMANPTPPGNQTLPQTPLTIVGSMVGWIGTNAPLVGVAVLAIALAGFLYARSRTAARAVMPRDQELPPSGGDAARSRLDEPDEEQQKFYSSMIHVLNEIDFQLGDLEATLRDRGAGYRFPVQEASTIVDRFFYSCQVGEERIKSARAAATITAAQEEDLNDQLHAAVRKMVALSRQSETLHALVRERSGADVTS